ncbi:MAG: hypothetical protein NWE76_01785, partial [Candidatus Bathyarchaeota archaeon]|nr:hypothetical protein [Candidatus Bathyarchaeota archaeon]
MNAVRLKELIEYLPRPELIRGEHFDQDIEDMDMVSSRDAEITHFAVNYAETNFAWKFIKALIHNHIPLPPPVDIDDEWLIRTYRFETDPTYKDEAIRGAHMLNKRSMEMTKYALKGMIMSPDNNSTEEIESKINISADVITAFEKIFFNVRDRRDEILFVSQVVYPEGRIVECIDDYIRRESLGNLIMRAGYNNG